MAIQEEGSDASLYIGSNSVCVSSVMSDSFWPRGLQHTRLLCPWGSPGKNTGVGCQALNPRGRLNPGIEPVSLASPTLVHSSPRTSPGKSRRD